MTRKNTNDENGTSLTPLRIEQPLPVTAVGIENMKESYSDAMSPHRRIFKWFARRPTAATRLAILASVLPEGVSDDEILRYMCVGPKKDLNTSIEDYVIEKEATKDTRDGSIEDHFGYEYPHSRLPNKAEFEELHDTVKQQWEGQLPTILDPTAGGGTIPFESARYGFPTISNELNPVAWLINKVILEYAQSEKSLNNEVRRWANEINNRARENLSDYFPTRNGVEPNYYFRAYSIACPSCGGTIPISNSWWFNKNNNIAVVPKFDGDNLSYQCGDLSEITTPENYDPSSGTVDGGDAECPHCGVVTEREQIAELFRTGKFDYEVCGIKYASKINGSKYHSPTEQDHEAIEAAKDKIESSVDLSTLLREERYLGLYDRAGPYGVTQWRDLYSPRQLLSHANYLEAFEDVKSDILEKYPSERSEAILVLLSFIGSRQINHNSRLVPIHTRFGYVDNMLGNNGFFFKWYFGETNPLAGGKSYESWTDNTLENYEKVVDYYEDRSTETTILQGDASNLSVDDESVQAVVIDPPYGDNIMYAETADAFYVWLKLYLEDQFPDQFRQPESNKQDEAVENPIIVQEDDENSKSNAARQRYENLMGDIFSEAYRVLESGGVITIYFTDKEVGAWDSLTMSLINAGFTITATHTISSESPERIGVRGKSSADTSLLLTCRKPAVETDQSGQIPTLWGDIKEKSQRAARDKANELLDSNPHLTKTDVIISAFGPTLRVFTEEYPVVDKHDNPVRPKQALEEARKAVTEILIERELKNNLDEVDSLTRWYILSWLVYENESMPYDEARQLGIGVGVHVDDIKRNTKIWGKSGDSLVLKGQNYRVRDYSAIEEGEKRRERAYPINPQDTSFDYNIDTVHAALNVLETKGGDFTWNWLKERDLQNASWFIKTVQSLLQVLPQDHQDYDLLVNLASGETGQLLDIDKDFLNREPESEETRTTLEDF